MWDCRSGRLKECTEIGTRSSEAKLHDTITELDLLVQRASRVGHLVFYEALKRCMAQKDLVLGSRVHALAVKCGLESNKFLANHIICMYASHGKLEEAMKVFTKVDSPCRHMWASIILAHARLGQPVQAIKLYRQMHSSGVKPDSHIFVAVLKACAIAEDLCSGREVHSDILRLVDKPNVFVVNCLVSMYAKCGSLEDARTIFDDSPSKDVVTWTAMIAGYALHGLGQEALSLYETMQHQGMSPADAVTFVCLLRACSTVGALHEGKKLHTQIRRRGFLADPLVANSLINMYAKSGSPEDARRVFDSLPARDVVTWNTMIAGYAQQGLGQEALTLYANMQLEGIILADAVTFVSLLQACASAGDLHQGKEIHAHVQERGLEGDVAIGNCLVTMYAKCGSLADARQVFETMRTRDVVTWNAMIAGYAQHGLGEEALLIYGRMQERGMKPADVVTLVCLLQACGRVLGLERGREIHAHISVFGLETFDPILGNALIDMYSRCGSMLDAELVFSEMAMRDASAWNALIQGYSRQGDSDRVFALFHKMKQEGVKPNSITLLGVLTACSHVGLVDEAQELFEVMSKTFGISPAIEHYTVLIDVLGRAGQLVQAMALVKTMPFQPDSVLWSTLLGACRNWGNVELGRRAFDGAMLLDRSDASAYDLMVNIYSAAHMHNEARAIHEMRMKETRTSSGQSWWTDPGGVVHAFAVGNGDLTDQMYTQLKSIVGVLKEVG